MVCVLFLLHNRQQSQAPVPNALHIDLNDNLGETIAKRVNAVGAGIGQGVLSTLNGAADLFDLPHQTLQEKQDELAQQNRENPVLNAVGYGGETLMEFLLGDEGFKSLSLGDKLAKSAAVAKTLQGSPRIMEALKTGAALLKAGGELTPEEMQVVKQYPRIAKLVGLGAEATRAGVTQAVQTGVRTQGSLGTRASAGAKESAEMAGTLQYLVRAGVFAGVGKLGMIYPQVVR